MIQSQTPSHPDNVIMHKNVKLIKTRLLAQK